MLFPTRCRSIQGYLVLTALATSLNGNSACNPTKSPDTEAVSWEHHLGKTFILNGTTAALGEFPHQVSLYSTVNDESFCGGSILTPRLVLTAAHCVVQLLQSDFKVIAGLTDLTLIGKGNEQIRNASFIYINEEYDDRRKINDIAIIELDSPLEFNEHVSNINLPKGNESFQGNVTAAGWGLTEDHIYSNKLKKADLSIVTNDKCKRIYGKSSLRVTENNFCAGVWEGGVCHGDSGGPAICETSPGPSTAPVLCGVVSFGGRCGRTPGVFTRIASFVTWIEQAEDNIKAHKTAEKLAVNGINSWNENLETPLHQAATLADKNVAVKVIKLLIEVGAVVSAEDSEGFTFLHRLLDDGANKINSNQFRSLVDYLVLENLFSLFNIREPSQGRTPLMLVAANLDLNLDTLSLLRNNKVDFTLLDNRGKSVLFYAVEGNNNQKLLADILNLETPILSEAIAEMNENLVRLLVQLGADVNGRNANLEAPLHHAAASNDKVFGVKIIKFLIDKGADTFVVDGEGQTFLHKLLSDGTTINPSELLDMAQYIFSKRSSTLFNIQDAKVGATPFMLAAKNVELDSSTLKFLRRIAVNFSMVDNADRPYMFYAAQGNKNSKLLTNIKSSIKHLNLSKAIEATDEHSVKVLTWLGADLNATNDNLETPLHLTADAASKNTTFAVNIIKFLIDSGANAYAEDGDKFTFLHRSVIQYSIYENNGRIIKTLRLLKPFTINTAQFHDIAVFLVSRNLSGLFNVPGGPDEATPFQLAVKIVEIGRETLTLLKNNGVNFNALDVDGQSVLFYATWGNLTVSLISDLVDLGVNPYHLANNNYSMLHMAAFNGNVELLKFFLDKGLNVNAQDKNGNTPLYWAVVGPFKPNNFETVRFLLRNGAKSDILNNRDRKTPLDMFNSLREFFQNADKISSCFSLGSSC